MGELSRILMTYDLLVILVDHPTHQIMNSPPFFCSSRNQIIFSHSFPSNTDIFFFSVHCMNRFFVAILHPL